MNLASGRPKSFLLREWQLPGLVACLLAALLINPAAGATSEGGSEAKDAPAAGGTPAVPPSRTTRTMRDEPGLHGERYFMKRPAVGMKLTYEYKDEARTSRGSRVKDSYHKFKEQVGFETEGWLYHPALLQYSLLFEPEWSQAQETMDPGDSASIETFSPDYAVTASLLNQKPYTVNLFARRREIPVWEAFAGNTESIVESYGGGVQFKYKVLPTSFGYEHIETDQSGFYISQNVRDNFTLASTHQSVRSNTTLSSTYSDDARTTETQESRVENLNNTLLNTYRLTRDNRMTLYSTAAYRTQDTDILNTDNFRIREHLNWRHRPNLQSNYTITHNRQDSGDYSSDLTSAEARLTHLLYENLTTNVGGRLHRYGYTGGEETAYEGLLDFAYSRPCSWGTLNLNTGWDYIYTDRSGFTDSVVQVTGETHVLETWQETYLDNYNVDLDSILVANSSGTEIYFENIDYSLEEINGYVRISRLAFGAIADGQVVSVNYRYLRNGEYDDTLLTEGYGINFDLFRDWRFSYNYLRARQDILSGEAPDKLVDDTVQRANIRYDLGWSDTSLTYEDSDRKSDLAFTQWRLEETLRIRPQRRLAFSLKGYYGQTDYQQREDIREFFGGVATVDWLLARWCKFRLEGYWDTIDSEEEETENVGVKAGLEFRYRIWTARLTYELTDQNYISSDYERTRQLIRLEIIRIMW